MTSLLAELAPSKKNKISLSDYDFQKDVQNRIFLSQMSDFDVQLMEEILFSSLKTSIDKIAQNLEKDTASVSASLHKLSQTGLLQIENDQVFVDKEMRKYFEAQMLKFEEDFEPGMDFLQSLLRKVPIHVLPTWYSIPRTSNNIFESILEKYLLTPQTFQRYLIELTFQDPLLSEILKDVYSSETLELDADFLIKKYDLSKEKFEEYMLQLEFSLVCCLGYKKEGNHWIEKVTPFHEWKQYINFLCSTKTSSIIDDENIIKKRPTDYAFIEDMAILLEAARSEGIPLEKTIDGILPSRKALASLLPKFHNLCLEASQLLAYIARLIEKIKLVKLADVTDKKLIVTEKTIEWLNLKTESQAMFLYRHPLNRPLHLGASEGIFNDKSLREAEKSIRRVLDKGWVVFDEFLEGASVALNDSQQIMLKRTGRHWKYSLPQYSENEKLFLHKIIFEWLFEVGIVQIGTYKGLSCFRVTEIGVSLFS